MNFLKNWCTSLTCKQHQQSFIKFWSLVPKKWGFRQTDRHTTYHCYFKVTDENCSSGTKNKMKSDKMKWKPQGGITSQNHKSATKKSSFFKSRARDCYNPLRPSVGWSIDRSFVGDFGIPAPAQFPIALVHQRAFWSIRVVCIRP